MASFSLNEKVTDKVFDVAIAKANFTKYVQVIKTKSYSNRILHRLEDVTLRAGHTFGDVENKIVDESGATAINLEIEELYSITKFDKQIFDSIEDPEAAIVRQFINKLGESIANSFDKYILGLIANTRYNVLNLANAVEWDGTYETYADVVDTLNYNGYSTTAILPIQWRKDVKNWFATELVTEASITAPGEIDSTVVEYGRHIKGALPAGKVVGAVFSPEQLVIYRQPQIKLNVFSPDNNFELATQNAYAAMASVYVGFGGVAEAFIPLVTPSGESSSNESSSADESSSSEESS